MKHTNDWPPQMGPDFEHLPVDFFIGMILFIILLWGYRTYRGYRTYDRYKQQKAL